MKPFERLRLNFEIKATSPSSKIFDHVPGDLECGHQRPQLDLLTGSSQKSLLKLGQLDQQVDTDFLRQLQTVYKQMDFSDNVL